MSSIFCRAGIKIKSTHIKLIKHIDNGKIKKQLHKVNLTLNRGSIKMYSLTQVCYLFSIVDYSAHIANVLIT